MELLLVCRFIKLAVFSNSICCVTRQSWDAVCDVHSWTHKKVRQVARSQQVSGQCSTEPIGTGYLIENEWSMAEVDPYCAWTQNNQPLQRDKALRIMPGIAIPTWRRAREGGYGMTAVDEDRTLTCLGCSEDMVMMKTHTRPVSHHTRLWHCWHQILRLEYMKHTMQRIVV